MKRICIRPLALLLITVITFSTAVVPRTAAQDGGCDETDVVTTLQASITILRAQLAGADPAQIQQVIDQLSALQARCAPVPPSPEPPTATPTPPPTNTPNPPPSASGLAVGSALYTYEQTDLFAEPNPSSDKTSLPACRPVEILELRNGWAQVEYQAVFDDATLTELGWVLTDIFAKSLVGYRVQDPSKIRADAQGFPAVPVYYSEYLTGEANNKDPQFRLQKRYMFGGTDPSALITFGEFRTLPPFELLAGEITGRNEKKPEGWVSFEKQDLFDDPGLTPWVWFDPSNIAELLVGQTLLTTFQPTRIRPTPNLDAQPIGNPLPSGFPVRVIDVSPDGEWLYVAARGRRWVYEQRITPRPFEVQSQVTFVLSEVNLRDAPSFSSNATLTTVNYLTRVDIKEVTPDKQWARVRLTFQDTGKVDDNNKWVHTCLLDFIR